MVYRSGDDFTVLVVCTGNVCRSPAIERLLRSAFGSAGITVHSAGTGALIGEPIQPPMARLLEERGVDGGAFAARHVTEEQINGTDIILTATREHRAAVVEHVPSAIRRTFTVREFARLVEQVDPVRLNVAAGPGGPPAKRFAALVPLAAAERAQVDPELDDIVDPYRRSEAVYQESFGQILEAVRSIVRVVIGVPAQESAR